MELESATGKLNAYFDGRQPEIMGMIERLVNMDSFSEDGEDVNKVGETVSGWMREAGFHTEKIAKPAIDPDESWMEKLGNVFSARTHEREAGPGIVFLGHMDTVFPAGTAAARPFRVEGGRAYGPGVADMKAGVVANMFAARALKDLGLIDVPMTLMFSPDEELGAPTATRVYRERISGARAVICAEPGFPDGGVTTERRGSGHFHMRISGISAHAGRCYEDGASAILELAHKIGALDAFVDAQAQTIVNTGLISGGNSANAVAPWADARIHITFNTVEAAERLVENVRAVAARTFVSRTTTRISGGIRLHPLGIHGGRGNTVRHGGTGLRSYGRLHHPAQPGARGVRSRIHRQRAGHPLHLQHGPRRGGTPLPQRIPVGGHRVAALQDDRAYRHSGRPGVSLHPRIGSPIRVTPLSGEQPKLSHAAAERGKADARFARRRLFPFRVPPLSGWKP